MQNPFRRPRTVDSEQDFDTLIPVPAVDHELDGETVVLLEPRFRGWPVLGRWLQPRLGPERAYVKVRLEHRGSWLWGRLDEGLDVRGLAEAFRSAFPEEADDAPQRIRLYLAGLQKHGFVRFLARSGA